MVRPIVKDPLFLAVKAKPAGPGDAALGQDLVDTLLANAASCVGMAANMIGSAKSVIVVADGNTPLLMYNPQILRAAGPFEAEEGCLSLSGVRKTNRFRTVRVRWQDASFKRKERDFSGWTAQIIQHEIDHLNGILI